MSTTQNQNLPSTRRLLKATGLSMAVAALLLVTVVMKIWEMRTSRHCKRNAMPRRKPPANWCRVTRANALMCRSPLRLRHLSHCAHYE